MVFYREDLLIGFLGGITFLLLLIAIFFLIYRYWFLPQRLSNHDRTCMYAHYLPYNNILTDKFSALLTYNINVSRSNCPQLGPITRPYGFKTYKIMSNGLNYGYLFQSDNILIVAFAGTFYKEQWQYNFKTKLVPAIGQINNATIQTKIHKGFFEIYNGLKDQLRFLIQKFIRSNSKFYLTGISLGAAISTIAAMDLAIYQPDVITFASPRVFNNEGAMILDKLSPNLIRVYNTEDVITDIPLPPEYTHVGKNYPFTLNLGSRYNNHVTAYLKYFNIGNGNFTKNNFYKIS